MPIRKSARVAVLLAAGLALAGAAQRPLFAPDAAASNTAKNARAWTKTPGNDAGVIRFAVIGDRTGLARPGVFEQAVKQADMLRPEFLINVGDLVEGYTQDTAEVAREWGHIEQAVNAMQTPFFYVVGNHDMGNQQMLDYWRGRRGNPWYAFEWKGALFLVLDTEDPPRDMSPAFAAQFRAMAKAMETDPVGTEAKLKEALGKVNDDRARGASDPSLADLEKARFSEEQVRWALDVLERHKDARWTFVLMHKPAWKLASPAFDRIEKALGSRGYTVIAGHNHYYAHEVRNGRDYLTMGTAGAISHQHGAGEMDHLAWVTLDKGAPDIALLKLTGVLDRSGESGQTMAK